MNFYLLKPSVALISGAILLSSCFTMIKPIEEQDKKDANPILTLTPYEAPSSAHIRGLQLLSDELGWASGANGTILRMTNGYTWEVIKPEGYEHLNFRDIHGFDSQTVVAMAAGDEGRIIRTQNGGATWIEVYTNLDEGIFLDGIDFDGDIGYCIGDPLYGKNHILRSTDKGKSWKRIEPKTMGFAIPGEGSYAASGTTVVSIDGFTYAAYGGDSVIRVLKNEGYLKEWKPVSAPLRIGEGCGIFSMAFSSKKNGVAVGGCYLDSTSSQSNLAITMNGGNSWLESKGTVPRGYRSCVAYSRVLEAFICCGRTGVDISYNQGRDWSALSDEGYYTCATAQSSAWLMGKNGKLAKLSW